MATKRGAEGKGGGYGALQASDASRRYSAALDFLPTPCAVSAEQLVGGPHGPVRLLLLQQGQPLAQVHRQQYHRWQKDQRDAEFGRVPDIHCAESQRDFQQWVAPPVVGCQDVRMVGGAQGSTDLEVQPVQQVVEVAVVGHCQR